MPGAAAHGPGAARARRPAGGGDWTPLVDLGAEAAAAGVHGSVFAAGDRALLALVNRRDEPFVAVLARGRRSRCPGAGSAALVCRRRLGAVRAWSRGPRSRRRRPSRTAGRADVPSARRRAVLRQARTHRRTTSWCRPGERVLTVRYRQRETGMYDGAPYVDEWKPLPPRLHDQRTLERVAVLDRPVAVAAIEEDVTGLDLAEARAYAASARGPAADGGRVAARRRAARVPAARDRWSGTGPSPSTATAARGSSCSRAASDHVARGVATGTSTAGRRHPEFSAKLPPARRSGWIASSSIGFRVCWEEDAAWARSTG